MEAMVRANGEDREVLEMSLCVLGWIKAGVIVEDMCWVGAVREFVWGENWEGAERVPEGELVGEWRLKSPELS